MSLVATSTEKTKTIYWNEKVLAGFLYIYLVSYVCGNMKKKVKRRSSREKGVVSIVGKNCEHCEGEKWNKNTALGTVCLLINGLQFFIGCVIFAYGYVCVVVLFKKAH